MPEKGFFAEPNVIACLEGNIAVFYEFLSGVKKGCGQGVIKIS
ncbi:hypothetical protein V5K00_RS22310 [Enterobacter asburiae]